MSDQDNSEDTKTEDPTSAELKAAVEALAESEAATKAAEDRAEALEAESRILMAERDAEEKKTGKSKGKIKAVFRRASHPYETGEGDRKYIKGQKVTFDTVAAYNRWFRRGACETDQDREARLVGESARQARQLRVAKDG